jgi:hypothetical protein
MATRHFSWIPLMLTASLLMTVGCGADFSTQNPPQLSIQYGAPDGPTAPFTSGAPIFVASPSELEKVSFLDLDLNNIGGVDMQILNAYIAAGSNQYVTLEWAENAVADATGFQAYKSGDAVLVCQPDQANSSAINLPTPAANISASCVFPLTLAGEDATGIGGSRRLRLRYTFDALNEVPDENPIRLVIHVNEDSSSLTLGGVLLLDIEVEACGAQMVLSATAIQFTAANPNVPEKQELCIYNEGCADLTINNIFVKNPSAGDVFKVEAKSDEPVIGAVISPQAENPDNPDKLCVDVVYAPFLAEEGDNVEANFIVIESAGVSKTVPVSKGDCQFLYDITHSDLVESGADYLDFSGIVFPDTGEKIITVTNLADCPITLNSMEFAGTSDLLTLGGAFWAEVFKNGESQGTYGLPGAQSLSKVVLANPNTSMDIHVHYEPPEGVAVEPSKVQLHLITGSGVSFDWERLIQAGDKQSNLSIGPAQTAGENQVLFWFASDSGIEKVKTLAVYNYGLEAATITGMTLSGTQLGLPAPTDFYLVDDGVIVVGGEVQPTEIAALSMLAVDVGFNPTSGSFKPQGQVNIWTDETPEGSSDFADFVVSLLGNVELDANLPTADAGSPEEYVGYKAGDTVTLNGSGSEDGDAEIFSFGYFWWLVDKPDQSVAKLNEPGGGEVFSTFQADKPGTYRVNLFVAGQDVSTSASHFSDQTSVTIEVAP